MNTTPEILYEDTHILVCVKPSGVPVQTKSIGTPDLESLLKNHLTASVKGSGRKPPYLAVIHRLDQPVRGILVFAKTPDAAKKLNHQMQEDRFGKYYQAVVCGRLPEESGTLTNYLVKDGRTNTSRICEKNTPGAKHAELSYEVVSTSDATGLSIVNIRLKTGRHHQIRVQMAGAGAPLQGDNKYNPAYTRQKGYCPIALCAYRLQFTHPITGEKLDFSIDCSWKN